MNNHEYGTLPDEFNRNYRASPKKEKEKKDRKWLLAHKLKIMLVATLLVLPFTVNIGLWKLNAFVFTEGTYQCGNTYVHFAEDSSWFFNGSYFIPMSWDNETMTYRAAGAYPQHEGCEMNVDYYLINASGTISTTMNGIKLLNPFTQKIEEYRLVDKQFNTTYIDHYNLYGPQLTDWWYGLGQPQFDFAAAYPRMIQFEGEYAIIVVNNTYQSWDDSWEFKVKCEDCHLTFIPEGEVRYEFYNGEKDVVYSTINPIDGILYFKENNCYIALNLFCSNVFHR